MSATDVPPASTPPPQRPHSAAADREAVREELFGGAILLLADIRAVYLLLNEGRARVISRFFGISGPGSGLVTLIMLVSRRGDRQREVRRALSAPGTPELGDVALGASVVTESVRLIAGATAGEYPLLRPARPRRAGRPRDAPGAALDGAPRPELRTPGARGARSSLRTHHPTQPATVRATELRRRSVAASARPEARGEPAPSAACSPAAGLPTRHRGPGSSTRR